MQERFNEQNAEFAARVFKYFLENQKEKKELLSNSNKHLVVLTALAYQGECSNVKLKRIFPILNLQDSIGILEESGLISITKGDSLKYRDYTITDKLREKTSSEHFIRDTLYVFANCIMNMDIYISKNNIKAWNLLALMLEASLKTAMSTPYVDLGRDAMLSIPGNQSNRMICRKNLESMGVIKPMIAGGKKSNAGKFILNRQAYIIERS